MWQAILLVLKIIGIVLLVLLACLLVVLLSIMFVPVRYKIKAAKTDVITGDIRISWFLRIINVRIYYKDQLNAVFRIFGIPVYDYSRREELAKKKSEKAEKKETKSDKKAEKSKRKEKKRTQKNAKYRLKKENQNQKEIIIHPEEEHSHSLNENAAKAANGSKPKDQIPIDKGRVHKKKQNLWKKLQDFFNKISSIISGICDKITDIAHRLQHYLQLWERDEVKSTFKICKKQLFKIWNHVRPRKLQLYLRIGFDDPAVTGQILAYYSMLFPIFGNTIKIQPEFEDTILEGNLYAKGKITVFVFVQVAWTIFFNKDIRNFLELLKKEER